MARLLDRASAAWSAFRGRSLKMDSLELWREVFGGRTSWAGKDVNLTTALQVSTALACGRVIAEGIAMLPWKVLQQVDRTKRAAIDHPLYDKLALNPNPLQTAFEFQETLGLHLGFCGNGFIWTPMVSRQIDALYLLDPKWVTVKYKWPELPTFSVQMPGGARVEMSSAEIWHVRGPSWSAYVGLEFMQLAREALGLSMAMEEGQARLQSQGVRMPGHLSVEGKLTEEQHKKLEKWITEHHAGAENSGRPMILDMAAKWVSQAMSNVDGQVLEQRKFAVEEVCRFMRVLPIMVGHADKTATYASSEQMFLAHSMYTSGPWARRLEQSADKRLLSREERANGYYTKLNEKAMLRMATRDQGEFIARMVLTGVYTRNEGRDKLDENPLAGLDVPLAPANTFVGNPPSGDEKPAEPPTTDE